MKGQFPQHGKSEAGYNISGVKWYWCTPCGRYRNCHNTHSHRQGNNYTPKYRPQVAAAKTVSQRAQSLPARANVASVPSTQSSPLIE